MEQRLTIVTLGVKDLNNASAFYEDKFGWKKMNSSNEFIHFFKLNGILLSLYPKEKLAEDTTVNYKDNGFKGFTLAYNTFFPQNQKDNMVLKDLHWPIIQDQKKRLMS